MFESPVKIRDLILFSIASVIIIFYILLSSFFDTRTKIVFCDVGQGDGAYIRIKNTFDVVIDSGPDRKILDCLGKYMPFYDRTIELAFISHDQKDHFGGFEYLLDRYDIKKIIMPDLETSVQSFKQLKQKILDKKIPVIAISSQMKIRVMNDVFTFLWPKDHCVAADNNDCSLVFGFQENAFRVLFTGDASPKVLNFISSCTERTCAFSTNINILKIPHHGSKNGLIEKFLRLADPRVGVISVGKNNSYGHPSKSILDMLLSHKVKIRRTDEEGDIIFRIH